MAVKKPKLAIIDSHGLIHRAYHALPPMTARDGRPTNAAYGFTTMLLKMITTLKPTHVVAAFDLPGPTFRHEQFEDYKAHREAADDDLVAQFDVVRDIVDAFNIPILEKPRYEADDIIGTVATKVKGVDKVIITGDKDTLQLIDDDTSVFTLKRGITDTILYDEEAVQESYGFPSDLVPDYKGLAGDSSDNIPGVAGVGDKTARELIGQYGSIEEIYKHLDELPKRAQTRLTGHKKDALLSRKLATIKRNVPVQFKLDDAVFTDFDSDAVHVLFEELGFRSLLSRIPKSSRGGQQPTLFQQDATGNKQHADDVELPDNYHLVTTDKEKESLKKELKKQMVVAFDTENDRLGAREYPIIGMSFAYKKGKTVEAFYVPVSPEGVPEWRGVLESEKIKKIGHNLKYDLEVIRQSDVDLKGIFFDTMIADFLLHPERRQHKLDVVVLEELGHRCIPIEQLIGEGKNQKAMSDVPLPLLAQYAAEDADVTFQLYETLAPRIKDNGLTRVFAEFEMPIVRVIADMELTGVAVDTDALQELKKTVAKRIASLQKAIWKHAGSEFNINSTQQLRDVLYDTLQLPTDGISRTQSGFSTAARELSKLRQHHPIIELLEEYRELTKLQSTYIEPLPTLIEDDSRIYAQFHQVGAATGRFSSTDPNLQNIPVRTETGQEIRAAFVAPRGRRLVKADYSQIDLRVAAHLSHDEAMIDTFRQGGDIHAATAALVNDVAPAKVTPKQRRDAKALNFGVLYGMGAASFAESAGISVEEARSYIERYYEQFASLAEYREEVLAQAEELGFVETMFGRRRPVPELNARAANIRAQAERVAFNFPIQGTAADILKKAMVELHAYLEKKHPDAKLVLTVHDELVVEADKDKAEAIGKDMRKIMSSVADLDVPLDVDVAIGSNWRDLKEL